MNFLSSLFRPAAKRRAHADLLRLDDHLLRDIGISRADLPQLMHAPRAANHRDHR
jgi:uncharacterized protein YjiS (DUF1127 family)